MREEFDLFGFVCAVLGIPVALFIMLWQWVVVVLGIASLFVSCVAPSEAQTKLQPLDTQQEPVLLRLETPTRVRAGQEATIRVILRNPFRDEQITLTAHASYMVGEAEVTTTASTNLTIDRSLVVRADINLAVLSLVAGSPTFDGVAVTGVRNNNNVWTFGGLLLPADGNDHLLELRVIR